jgi:Domain of unknown function (DUF5134)
VPVVVVVAALLPVLVYCAVRALTPGRARGDAHHRDLYVWHLVLGLAMLAALAGLSPLAALGVLAVSALGVGWGIRSIARPVGGGLYARLAVGAAAMAVMSVAVATPAQAAPPSGNAMGMAGMGASGSVGWLPLVGLALLGALGAAGASAALVAARRPASLVGRLDACCDVVMAGVMAVMLVAVL